MNTQREYFVSPLAEVVVHPEAENDLYQKASGLKAAYS
jgi:hypothetical protein